MHVISQGCNIHAHDIPVGTVILHPGYHIVPGPGRDVCHFIRWVLVIVDWPRRPVDRYWSTGRPVTIAGRPPPVDRSTSRRSWSTGSGGAVAAPPRRGGASDSPCIPVVVAAVVTGRPVDQYRSTGRPVDRPVVVTGRPVDQYRSTGRPVPVDRLTGRPAGGGRPVAAAVAGTGRPVTPSPATGDRSTGDRWPRPASTAPPLPVDRSPGGWRPVWPTGHRYRLPVVADRQPVPATGRYRRPVHFLVAGPT